MSNDDNNSNSNNSNNALLSLSPFLASGEFTRKERKASGYFFFFLFSQDKYTRSLTLLYQVNSEYISVLFKTTNKKKRTKKEQQLTLLSLSPPKKTFTGFHAVVPHFHFSTRLDEQLSSVSPSSRWSFGLGFILSLFLYLFVLDGGIRSTQ